MNCKQLKLGWILAGLLLGAGANAQQIDESIARELGLVKTATLPQKSGVFDVPLNVGKRMELVFPEQGSLRIKGVDQGKFDILNVNDSLFIEALEPLEKDITGIFTLRQSQQIIVLNLRTVDDVLPFVSRIIQPTPTRRQSAAQQAKATPALPGPSQLKGYEYDRYVELTAFAARSAYAPDRLLNAPKGLARVALSAHPKQIQKISRESRLKLTPISSWAHRGLHVTVVQIENTGGESLKLTPDVIRGQFVARSFQHNRIGNDDRNRYSAAYLVSLVPFAQAIAEL